MEQFWEQLKKNRWARCVLRMLSLVYACVIFLKKQAYVFNILKKESISVPVIVIGNVTLGGTGKSPIVSTLALILKNAGLTPGIISLGFGGIQPKTPMKVTETSNPRICGDEPVMHAYKTKLPVFICKKRARAAKALLSEFPKTDVILSDDGLQHLALKRDVEIIVLDETKASEKLFPLGRLREPWSRIFSADFLLSEYSYVDHVGWVERSETHQTQTWFTRKPKCIYHLHSGEVYPLNYFANQTVQLVTAIAKPERFLKTCEALHMNATLKAFPDHALFEYTDLNGFGNTPILMTEKDAVKCQNFKDLPIYIVQLEIEFDPRFIEGLFQRLKRTS